MGMSSLETVASLWNVTDKNGSRFELYESNERLYQREIARGPGYGHGPVTIINFENLENN